MIADEASPPRVWMAERRETYVICKNAPIDANCGENQECEDLIFASWAE